MSRENPARWGRRAVLRGAVAAAGAVMLRSLHRAFGARVAAQSVPKRIYLAPDDHTDYFWSGTDVDYQSAFLVMLDYYLAQADATAGNPTDRQSRWHCDGSYWVWTYERNRTPAQFARLMTRVRDGHISFPLNALVSASGGMPMEAVLRGMYYAGSLERRYGLRIPLAEEVENQTMPYGLGALWAGAGARYSWKGICGCDTLVPNPGDRPMEAYWWVGADGSRILVKWNSMLAGNQSMGGYAEAYDPFAVVDYVDSNAAFVARYPYRVIGAFGQGWDALKTTNQTCVDAAKAKTNASRRVIVSNMVDYFQDMEATYGSALPTQSCSFGNEWDLYCAAIAGISGRMKRAVEALRGAEALAAVVCMGDPAFDASRDRAERDRTWLNLGLFWEHNLGMVGRSGAVVDQRVAWQRRLATEVETYATGLRTAAGSRLGALIKKTGTGQRFYVLNPLSWARTDVADLPAMDGTVHAVDVETGRELPCQRVSIGGRATTRVLVEGVPSLGYRVVELLPGAGAAYADAASVAGGAIESDRYRLTLASHGAITSLIDKTRSNREFVRAVSSRLANDLGPGSGALTVENAGPVSVTLLATCTTPIAHTTRVTLYRGIDRIAVENEITQKFSDVQTWAYSFALDAPTTWHEEVGAVICARLLADGGHYSPRNARYDWLTLNHFADMSAGDVGVTLSNADCYFMHLGQSTVSALDVATPQISVLAGGRVVNGTNGLPDQGGDKHFLQRFALRTHGTFDSAAAMRFALEHQNPLIAGEVTGGTVFPATMHSLVSVSNPDVVLWALKPADDGIGTAGFTARLWNLSGAPASFTLRTAAPLVGVQDVTHIETPTGIRTAVTGALTRTLPAHQIRSFALFCTLPPGTTPTPTARNRLHLPAIRARNSPAGDCGGDAGPALPT